MSLITCCPACGTMFRVVPDQLKISEGWVRCGHCAEVFDAAANMMGDGPLAPLAPLDPPPLDADTEPGGPHLPDLPVRPGLPMRQDMPDQPHPQPSDSELKESALDQPFVFRRSDLGLADGSNPESLAPESVSPQPHADASLQDDESVLEDVSFMRHARRKAYWRRPAVRAFVSLVALALAAVLALQFAVQERDRLAATEPGLRPWLEQLCGLLNCRVSAPRQIETLAIDSSSFNRVRSDAYKLSFTLKNSAGMPVAIPAMELTLTDGQDQPLMRRVLTPADMGASAPVIGPGAEWSSSVALAVSTDGQGGRVAGYRLLAFYP